MLLKSFGVQKWSKWLSSLISFWTNYASKTTALWILFPKSLLIGLTPSVSGQHTHIYQMTKVILPTEEYCLSATLPNVKPLPVVDTQFDHTAFFLRHQWVTWRDILISTCERTLTPALCGSKWSLIVPLTSCPYNFNGMSSTFKISETITPSSNIPPVLSLALVAMPPQISAFKSLMITKSHSCQWQDCQVFQLER